jgi:hypothetical protein
VADFMPQGELWLVAMAISSHLRRKRLKKNPPEVSTEAIIRKAVPLQAWSGPEGSRQLRFPDFMTTAQDCGKVSLTHRPPLHPRNTPGTRLC